MTIQYTLNEVETVAKKILEHSNSKIFLFEGDLGAGKTTLIKALVKLLGSDDTVSSPTFSLVNDYEGKDQLIHHFDLYRIDNEEDLYNFGIETYIYSNNYVLVEWPNVLQPLLQDTYSTIKISLSENSSRTLQIL